MVGMDDRPTVRQVYALAGALCDGAGLAFPRSRSQASTLIERLRIDTGHPAPRLADLPVQFFRGVAGGGGDADALETGTTSGGRARSRPSS